MKKISSYKINNKLIQNKLVQVQKESQKVKLIENGKKYFYYFLGISIPSLYIVYLLKSSGLMKKLEVDKRYQRKKKKIEESYGIDSDLNEQKLNEFDKKWGINKAMDDYEFKIKYGNKEMNQREEENSEILQDETKVPAIDAVNPAVPDVSNDTSPLEEESRVMFDPRLDKISKLNK